MIGLLRKLFGTKSQRDIRLMAPLVARINELEAGYRGLSEESLKAHTDSFRKRLARGETTDDLLCEAFATVKNACRRLVGREVEVCGQKRVWDMVPFDVQLMGGIALHKGRIAEMATGEGKTLVATLPLYLNALTGKPVHLVTVNDYLAKRDSEWMGTIFTYLGVSCGCIQNWMSPAERRAEYGKDITYGTNSEFGFDYLRDNGMAFRPEDQVQRGHFFAIVDEVDSILIDEARTPLIISGPSPESTHQFDKLKPRVERLVRQQSEICSRLMQEVRDLLPLVAPDAAEGEGAKKAPEGVTLDEAKERIRHRLYKVYHGMPKHKQLLHLLEIPAVRSLHEQVENMMLTDMNKDTARALTEELFFATDERGHEASLTERGCKELNPADPDAYVLPDIVAAMSEIDGNAALDLAARTEAKQKVQQLFAERSERIQNVDQLIKAYCLYEKDVHYVVMNNQVLIVDEFTGRILPGRRWSDGLHQAVEAKESVKIEQETQTLATITIQNYFRLYEKLAGMTGTAETEAEEFFQIYKLDVMVVPTNRPVRRLDNEDRVYKTKREKYKAIIDEIVDCHKRGQPVLVGTISVETSELLARMLRGAGVLNVNVLNAKYHDKEALIVANAGQKGAITIATNMAGRGTDIKLGEGVVPFDRALIQSPIRLDDRMPDSNKTLKAFLEENACGLHVIGTERHESRRIDRQLRGRCARQGDPGSSRFYTSLEDDLMRLFCPDRVARLLTRWGLEEGQELESSILTRSIQNAQRRVEQHNFSIRKRTLEYDDVMNKQRTIIYKLRGEIVRSTDVKDTLFGMIEEYVLAKAEELLLDGNDETAKAFMEWFQLTFPVPLPAEPAGGNQEEVERFCGRLMDRVREAYGIKSAANDPRTTALFERFILLRAIDINWQDYLRSMDNLREGIRLRAYGQRDPLIEYKKEAFEMFGTLMQNIRQEVAANLFRLAPVAATAQPPPRQTRVVHESVQTLGTGSASEPAAAPRRPAPAAPAAPPKPRDAVDRALESASTVQRAGPKVGRNDPCPCGSGKKFKKCCGAGL